MWTTILAVAPEAPTTVPQVPSESIGAILIALITGVTAILVAVIQRKSRAGNDPSNPSNSGGHFVVPEAEWIATRDKTTTTAAAQTELKERFEGHVQLSDKDIEELQRDVAWIKGRLGL